MTKHVHAEMIKAKVDNMELVVFIKNDRWEKLHSTCYLPAFEPKARYYMCLPQYEEECLHWLNGGTVEFLYCDDWGECGGYTESPEWYSDEWMMNEDNKFRIKPRKEKRWIISHKHALASMLYFDTEEEAVRALKDYFGGRVIEIEVEA